MSSADSRFPTYSQLMYPVMKGVEALGGSATGREVTSWVIENEGFSEDLISITYPGRPDDSILLDRIDWARSYCKLSGALESPKRSVFLITTLGREILGLQENHPRARLADLDKEVRAARVRRRSEAVVSGDAPEPASEPETADGDADPEAPGDRDWRDTLLRRLHALSPRGFEEFVMYLLREFGMELERVGGPNDEGIDGLGTAPISPVLSATVAVQVKRYDPDDERKPIGRAVVALFQRDASARGAERAVLVSLGRFSSVAQQTAVSSTPRVDLIDGQRLCELVLDKQLGVSLQPVVDRDWFDRFR